MWNDGKLTMNLTRYFLFTKLRPTDLDYNHVKDEAERINAHVIYITDDSDETCKVLKGIIVLGGQPTTYGCLHKNFPNFTITTIPTEFELDFWNLPDNVVKISAHPFDDIKKNLFKSLFNEKSLSTFISNERNPGNIREMVPSSTILTRGD